MVYKVAENNEAGKPYSVTWVFRCTWAHPFWHDYMLVLADLTTDTGEPPVLHKEGVTHEMMLFALDPDKPIDFGLDVKDMKLTPLMPPNHGYQFYAPTNTEARGRVQGHVDQIEAGVLSPDTDFRSVWDKIFIDGVSLARHG